MSQEHSSMTLQKMHAYTLLAQARKVLAAQIPV